MRICAIHGQVSETRPPTFIMTTTLNETLTTLVRDGFILVYNSETLDIVGTARALQKAGINNMEVTCRIADAAGKLKRLKKEVPGFKAGAASLLDYPVTQARFNAANAGKSIPSIAGMVESGADYLVSAVGFRAETYAAYAGRLPIVPGRATGTELHSPSTNSVQTSANCSPPRSSAA